MYLWCCLVLNESSTAGQPPQSRPHEATPSNHSLFRGYTSDIFLNTSKWKEEEVMLRLWLPYQRTQWPHLPWAHWACYTWFSQWSPSNSLTPRLSGGAPPPSISDLLSWTSTQHPDDHSLPLHTAMWGHRQGTGWIAATKMDLCVWLLLEGRHPMPPFPSPFWAPRFQVWHLHLPRCPNQR